MKRVRSAIANYNHETRSNRISIFTILIFIIIIILEALFLSNIINVKIGDTVQTFASVKVDDIYLDPSNTDKLYSYNIPKAEFQQKGYINPEKPMVALTFDDGPHPVNTIRILETLKKYNGKATFFMLGECIQRNKDIPKMVVDQGSEIGTHTWNHANLNKLTESEIIEQLSNSSDLILSLSGVKVKLFRPPYGNSNELVKSVAKTKEMSLILWNMDTEDWKSKDANKVSSNVLDNVKDGDIILMHDIYSSTADACEIIIRELTSRGYQLVTVSELFKFKGKNLEYGVKYYYCH